MQVTDAVTTPPNWELYRRTVVDIRFPDRTVRIKPRPRGTAEGPFPELPGPAGTVALHVVTAYDPHGRPALTEDNARAQARLLDELGRRGLAWWPATGSDVHGTHIEQSVAVAGLSDSAARELGRRFGQDAVFAWTPGTWRLLSCDGGATDIDAVLVRDAVGTIPTGAESRRRAPGRAPARPPTAPPPAGPETTPVSPPV
ncbi:DUF3293 domain-containing protein [Streptomyces sp. PU_AKi4]|uniref:DUF3293 domain-containing protein n=1 Tax=unclassified Streptomyces TaxID=2593676 RepID=UPI000A1DBB5E|nr:hypothetical protein B7767_43605 [Streptomyces sp. 13-12-16]